MTRLRVLAIVTACAFALAACGSSGDGSAAVDGSAASVNGQASGGAAAADPIGPITVESDATKAVEQLIGADGGSITATANDGTTFTLTVPVGALPSDTNVTATPATLQGLDFPTYTVIFGPTGTQFSDWATLAITPVTEVSVENQFLYRLNDEGTEFGAAFVDPMEKAPTILLDHFSGYGLADATTPERAAMLSKGANEAEARIQSEMASILGQERQKQLLGAEDGGLAAEAFDKYSKEYEEQVIAPRIAASGSSCEALKEALRTVLGFERQKQLLGVSESTAGSDFLSDVLAKNGGPCEKEAIEKCKAAKDPGILIQFWLGIERQKQLLGAGVDSVLDIPGLIKKARAICAPAAYDVETTIPSAPSGIKVTGLICSLAEPFSLRLTGDFIGRIKFTPSSDEAGSWAFKGKVGNAPMSVDGNGDYTVAVDEGTGQASSIDFTFTSTIHIPVVGDQTGGGPVSLPLTATEPCAEQQ